MTVFLRWVYAKQFHHVDSSWWLPFGGHIRTKFQRHFMSLKAEIMDRREALNELIDSFKVDIPE